MHMTWQLLVQGSFEVTCSAWRYKMVRSGTISVPEASTMQAQSMQVETLET